MTSTNLAEQDAGDLCRLTAWCSAATRWPFSRPVIRCARPISSLFRIPELITHNIICHRPSSSVVRTIRWGTSPDAVLQTGLNTAIIKSVAVKRLGGPPIPVEDNNGFTAILAILVDGDEISVTVVDDTAITWPARGDTVSLQVPGEVSAKDFTLIDDGISLQRKREGERTLTCQWFVNDIAA